MKNERKHLTNTYFNISFGSSPEQKVQLNTSNDQNACKTMRQVFCELPLA